MKDNIGLPLFFEGLALYEIIWKRILQPGMPQMTIWLVYIACWITKAKSPHSEYVLLNVFQLQQLLNQSISMLRYTYTACFLCYLKHDSLFFNLFLKLCIQT